MNEEILTDLTCNEDEQEQEQQEQQEQDSNKKSNEVVDIKSLIDLPFARVKRIMKSDVDVKLISQEAVILVTKAAELLVEHLAQESLQHTQSANRKTVLYQDLVNAVKESDQFDFLEDIIPEKATLNQLIEQRAKRS